VAAVIYLDTHVLAWLYAGRVDLLSGRARQLLESEDLLISPMVALELEYLHEIGRLTERSGTVLHSLQVQIGLRMCTLPFASVVEAARRQAWTRDPFDRVIVGHAAAAQSVLVTKDASTRRHYKRATW
jgi:PIN domain nuclease of toxin-antitoxin system